jgi:hypothetical protein
VIEFAWNVKALCKTFSSLVDTGSLVPACAGSCLKMGFSMTLLTICHSHYTSHSQIIRARLISARAILLLCSQGLHRVIPIRSFSLRLGGVLECARASQSSLTTRT